MNILILCRFDWCGSAFAATEAIRSAGGNAKHITLWKHPFGYGSDILFRVDPMRRENIEVKTTPEYAVCQEAIEWADVIHLWNSTDESFFGLLDVPKGKIKSVTFTGTAYRENHMSINRQMKKIGREVVTAHPTMRYSDEIENTFIPHAVDTQRYTPRPVVERIEGNIGCYYPGVKHSTSIHADIQFMESILPDGWRMVLKEKTPHDVRMERLSRCWLYFEYLDQSMGYFGRSPLEAAAFGIPGFSSVSPLAMAGADGLIGEPPQIINVNRTTVRGAFDACLNGAYGETSQAVRQWAEDYFSYPVIGKLYADFFKRVA